MYHSNYVTLIYSSSSSYTLKLYQNFLKKIFKKFSFKFIIINLPKKQKLKTFLKSPHVNKRSKENFKLFVYKFKLHTTLDFGFIKSLRYNVPKNIHLKIIYNN